MGEWGGVLVVGTGLIGTSVALAARAAGRQVWLAERDPDRLAMAIAMGAGFGLDDLGKAHEFAGHRQVEVAVIAVPPAVVGEVASAILKRGLAMTVTHVASVQSRPQADIETTHPSCEQFVGGHPIAGRERSGPHHASADLFQRRPWILCPTAHSSPEAIDTVSRLATDCGADVSIMSAAEHDALLARLSHVPQLVASALAGTLAGLDRAQTALAGTGLRDTSRLADSDPELWGEIIAANPGPVARALREIIEPLTRTAAALDAAAGHSDSEVGSAMVVRDLVARGRRGRDRLAGKHGQAAIRWSTVIVVVPDEPGALARLLVHAAEATVNVEDIRVDHSPGQPLGLVELDVAPDRGESLERALRARGWSATASPPPPD